MILLRSRHHELDDLRTLNHRFNTSWIMFFGTIPPGLNPGAVKFTTIERVALANDVSAFTEKPPRTEVESFDALLHNKQRLGKVHGRGPYTAQ